MKARFPRLLLPLYFLLLTSAKGQSISGIVNSYYQVTTINTVSNTLTLNTVVGLSVGTRVLVIQMKGAAINTANSSTYGDITSINQAGNYEFNTVCSISGNIITLQYQLINTYDVTQQVQLVSVPVYGTATVSGLLTANPWDPVSGTGGVLAIEATANVVVNSNIDLSGLGYQGGALQNYPVPPYNCSWAVTVSDYYTSLPPSDAFHTGGRKGEGITYYVLNQEYGKGKLASGGGGGNNNNTGGAGGGNYGGGGPGGNRTHESFFSCHGTDPGVGGAALAGFGYSVANNRVFLGGGGGSGHENNGVGEPGGNGGGIVIINSPSITAGGGSILSNGVAPTSPGNSNPAEAEGDGGGGGGAGGSIILNAASVTGAITVQANGANGSNASNNVNDCTGPGGGGGGGVIWVAGGAFPGSITGSVNGGANGVVSAGSSIAACRGSSNGAGPGLAGSMQTGYILPEGTSQVCAVLAASDLKSFTGQLEQNGTLLKWSMYDISSVQGYELERSTDRIHFDPVSSQTNTGNLNLSYTDPQFLLGSLYYRLKIINKNGSSDFSQIIYLDRQDGLKVQLISLQPNPAFNQLQITLHSKAQANGSVGVFDALGQKMLQWNGIFSEGYSNTNLDISRLASGTYFLVLQIEGQQVVRGFLKR